MSTAALSRVDNLDTNAGEGRKHHYNAFDINMNARLPNGGTVFGGLVTERNLRNICDEPDDPNMLLYCDDWQNDIPYRPTLKLAGIVSGRLGHYRQRVAAEPRGSPAGPDDDDRKQDQRPWLRGHWQPGRH